jgi:NAD(P)-dependent dehydrogenase (short-subunit alcohol dehydrogenase family)
MQKMPQQAADDFETFGGRTVVITGGASGIGLATARMVVDRGGSVILMGRSPERLKAAREALGSAASTIQLDVTDEDAVRIAFADIDRVDHLVTAAAGTLRGRSSISMPGMPANCSRSNTGGSTTASNTQRPAWLRTDPSCCFQAGSVASPPPKCRR